MKWLEQKYIMLLSSRLSLFKRKSGSLFNFRCPYCLDSQKNKHKARGYLFEKGESYVYHCHNCGEHKGFTRFLKEQDPSLYTEFVMEGIRDRGGSVLPASEPVPVVPKEGVLDRLKPVSGLPPTHVARRFVLDRQIPAKYHGELFYAPSFNTFVNDLIPGKLTGPDEPRLIIPFFSFKKEVVAFQGRAFSNDGIRYITIVLNPDVPKAFGLNHVNFNHPYCVFEGPFDSMFVPNSIAVGGSDLVGAVRHLESPKSNAVIVFDNEPRNHAIVTKLHRAIKDGYSVVIWPSDISDKDANQMILSGLTSEALVRIIRQHTYNGLRAEMAFTRWKRITEAAI
jgi:hypothetical protein